ncbi:MAG: DUF2460 domain-containing protein [Dehalococcoidia bacterium]|jgi:hypothetical protein
MAAWTTSWKPSYGFSFGPEHSTLITSLGGGAEQRRKKWTSPRLSFKMSFDARTEATIQAIKEFHKACYGSYSEFTFPNYGEAIKGARLACVNSNPDTITDSSSGFVTQGFDASHDVTIYGSGTSNNKVAGVSIVAAGTLTLDSGESLTAESANASLEVFKTYNVRFLNDVLSMRSVSYGIWALDVDLVEVL